MLEGEAPYVVFRVEEGEGHVVVRVDPPEVEEAAFLARFPYSVCRYALYALDIRDEPTPVLVRWTPPAAPRTEQLRYARHEPAVHRALGPSVTHTLSATHHADLGEPLPRPRTHPAPG
ncbi:hypothetical protein LO762_28795 [Actinocorallia sp. API 0066]|uniref:hypothetical protein n=1 Tax=Actinocorallia sp. API 0066 TaxID=2896846 RepID=UPI001E58E79B|nr:hypothetical protein [Actinocorallia sp. API 0066]MCD0453148.1 hypothetical protein [Actinocorallia sp. API 0066]